MLYSKWAVSSVRGEWVVPPATINDRISKTELARLLEFAIASRNLTEHNLREYDQSRFDNEFDFWVAYLNRFYGQNSDHTSGRTWDEIASQIDH